MPKTLGNALHHAQATGVAAMMCWRNVRLVVCDLGCVGGAARHISARGKNHYARIGTAVRVK